MASQGPRFPTAAVNLINAGTLENTDAWVNPTNVFSDNAAEAAITAASYDSPDISQILVMSGFGFTIPAGATIDGIIVEVERRSIIANSGKDFRVQLATGTVFANLVGTNKAVPATIWPSTATIAIYGGAADTWSAGLTAAQVNAAGFAVFLSCQANIANADIGVDFIRVTVHYTEAGPGAQPVYDAATESAAITTTSPATVVHTPIGTPKGALLFIEQSGTAVDDVSAVDYGGVVMTRVPTDGFAQDAVDELGAVYCYFLGENVPAGAQTISITHGGTGTKIATVVTLTASASSTAIVASGRVQNDVANPSVDLGSGTDSALRFVVIFSGLGAPASLALLTGMTAVTDHDFGTDSGRVDRETLASTGLFTIGYTAAQDDVAMIAVAVKEAVAAAARGPGLRTVLQAVQRASSW